MASRIVGLLMADVGIGGDLALMLKPREAAPAPPEPASDPKPDQHKGKGRKLTIEMRRFIRDSAGQPVSEIVAKVAEIYGVCISKAAVYTEWRSSHLPLGTAPSHPVRTPKTAFNSAKSCV